ncbi:hypothetical protein TDIS_1232 [Thermosulfurimonas dismutans]|uniref:Uncharacterized protein n=1 Tax=Thermosulfurimonas dismutans TaxID=999894 RepID=A0A179D3I0_9BACT|nr:hypothetical protein TDIS_1232 [Thermosulfurimonas dismutans]
MTIVSLTLIFGVISVAFAGSRGRMIQRLWQRHERGISGLIECWRSGRPMAACKRYLEEIVSAEVGLLAYGVSPKDPRLVCGIASKEEGLNVSRFVYELILQRFEKQTGWRPTATFPVSIETGNNNNS